MIPTTIINTAIFIILSILFSIPSAESRFQRRGLPGAVYTCTSTDFRGDCQWTPPSNRCIMQGPSGKGIQSLGPDPDGSCILFEKYDCTGREIQNVRFPGIASGLPTFGAFKCSASQGAQRGNSTLKLKALDPIADPRLAGGVGSAERSNHIEAIKAMEAAGFKQGMIGFRKGMYY